MGRAARVVLTVPRYALLAALTAVVGLSLLVFSLHLPLVDLAVTGTLPTRTRLDVLLRLYPFVGPPTSVGPVAGSAIVAVGALFGLDVAMVTYLMRNHDGGDDASGEHLVGAVLGVLGATCAAVGPTILAVILPVVGVSHSLMVLPLDGLEFALLALVAVVASINRVAAGL